MKQIICAEMWTNALIFHCLRAIVNLTIHTDDSIVTAELRQTQQANKRPLHSRIHVAPHYEHTNMQLHHSEINIPEQTSRCKFLCVPDPVDS